MFGRRGQGIPPAVATAVAVAVTVATADHGARARADGGEGGDLAVPTPIGTAAAIFNAQDAVVVIVLVVAAIVVTLVIKGYALWEDERATFAICG